MSGYGRTSEKACIDVQCPTCGAMPSYRCRTRTHRWSKPHTKRLLTYLRREAS